MRWKIYYRRGKAFSCDDGSWADAPADGVLAIVVSNGERRDVVSGGSFYRLTQDCVVCHEDADAILHAIGYEELSPIKFGWAVTPTEMSNVLRNIDTEQWS